MRPVAQQFAKALMPRICAAFMTEATKRVPPGTSVRPGLLHMLQQPSRVVADAPDTAGRGSASAALLAGSSSQRAAGAADAPTARRDASPACATAAAAPASGAKTFLETAKRSLDKAAYGKVRAGVCVGCLHCGVLTLAHPQFQSLLKAFKSETLSFDDLLTGAKETRRYEGPALMSSHHRNGRGSPC